MSDCQNRDRQQRVEFARQGFFLRQGALVVRGVHVSNAYYPTVPDINYYQSFAAVVVVRGHVSLIHIDDPNVPIALTDEFCSHFIVLESGYHIDWISTCGQRR